MYVYVCCQHFQTSSPHKLLGRLKTNFIWSLHGMGERKIVQAVLVTRPRWPPCPYMIKPLKNLLLRNQKADDLETWYAASMFKYYQTCSINDTGLTLTYFTAKSNLVPCAFVRGKKLKQWIFQKLMSSMI